MSIIVNNPKHDCFKHNFTIGEGLHFVWWGAY